MSQEEYMLAAIEAARTAYAEGDYAVGCVVATHDGVVTTGANRTHLDADATQHAEMIAIRKASEVLGTKRLSNCTLYSTHEPCPMCMSAAIWARVGTLVFGATMEDHKAFRDAFGNEAWPWRVIDIPAAEVAKRASSDIQIVPGYLREACLELFHE